jgi:hypothetical protein
VATLIDERLHSLLPSCPLVACLPPDKQNQNLKDCVKQTSAKFFCLGIDLTRGDLGCCVERDFFGPHLAAYQDNVPGYC